MTQTIPDRPMDRQGFLNPEALIAAAECLKVLGHPQRLKMIQLLLKGKQTVKALAEFCSLPSHMASEHLRLLQRCGFLKSIRQGKFVFYEVCEMHLASLMDCIQTRFGPVEMPQKPKEYETKS